MMKKFRDSLVDPLLILWKKFMESGNIPEIFRTAYVTPILKPGAPKSVAASYRPVSLTSHIVKTFERVVKMYLQNHLEYNIKLNIAQHGSRERTSGLSQLLENYEYILKGLEEGKNIESVYLDFSKAFDKVNIGILCARMRETEYMEN